jgi:hypothetical protein
MFFKDIQAIAENRRKSYLIAEAPLRSRPKQKGFPRKGGRPNAERQAEESAATRFLTFLKSPTPLMSG